MWAALVTATVTKDCPYLPDILRRGRERMGGVLSKQCPQRRDSKRTNTGIGGLNMGIDVLPHDRCDGWIGWIGVW
jgi:hypothetical protein